MAGKGEVDIRGRARNDSSSLAWTVISLKLGSATRVCIKLHNIKPTGSACSSPHGWLNLKELCRAANAMKWVAFWIDCFSDTLSYM